MCVYVCVCVPAPVPAPHVPPPAAIVPMFTIVLPIGPIVPISTESPSMAGSSSA